MNNEEIIIAILGGLFALSEALASIKWLQANSVFQLLRNVLRALSFKKA